MSELSNDELVKLNGVCHGDKTVSLTVAETDYCFKRLRGERLPSSEIAKRLGVKIGDVDRWIVAGRALEGRPAVPPPTVDEPLPETPGEKLRNRDRLRVVSGESAEVAKVPRIEATEVTYGKLEADDEPRPGGLDEALDDRESGEPTIKVGSGPPPPFNDPLIVAAIEVRRTAAACAEAEAAHEAAVERLQDEISAVRYVGVDPELSAEAPVLDFAPVEAGSLSSQAQLSKAIRVWAREQGIEVSPTGRLKAEVVAAYREAHPS